MEWRKSMMSAFRSLCTITGMESDGLVTSVEKIAFVHGEIPFQRGIMTALFFVCMSNAQHAIPI